MSDTPAAETPAHEKSKPDAMAASGEPSKAPVDVRVESRFDPDYDHLSGDARVCVTIRGLVPGSSVTVRAPGGEATFHYDGWSGRAERTPGAPIHGHGFD